MPMSGRALSTDSIGERAHIRDVRVIVRVLMGIALVRGVEDERRLSPGRRQG
jgi:hypothetical protein